MDSIRAVSCVGLCALLLLGVPARAAAPAYRSFSWAPVPAECRHITGFVWFNQKSQPAQVAAESLKQAAGRRALFSWDVHRDILNHPADVCRTPDGQPTAFRGVWPAQGTAATRERFDRFFGEFKAAGGQMDLFLLDFEGGYSNWSLGGGKDKEPLFRAIQSDPRFAELARKLGFSDLMTVCHWPGKRAYLKWNAVMAGVVDAALEAGVFQPAKRHYPALLGSNYGSVVMTEANAVPDLNGHFQWSESDLMGTHQAPSFYTWIGQLGDRKLDGRQPFGRTPYAGLLLTLNTLRALQRSSDKPIMPWIAWQRYAGDGPKSPPATVANTPYYRELVYHLALAGCDTILFWNPHPWSKNQKPEDLSMPADELLLDGLLADCNRRLAADRRECLTTAALPWDAPLLVTGLRLDDRAVWRVTAPAGVTKVTVKVDDQPRELAIDDQAGAWLTTAPGGRVTW